MTTYCFCSSSSKFARSRRIMPAVPDVPMTITGIHRCSSTERNLAQPHRLIDELRVHQSAHRGAEHDVSEVQQHQSEQEVRRRESEESMNVRP